MRTVLFAGAVFTAVIFIQQSTLDKIMCIEEESYIQAELWGEQPQIPQWEACVDEIITDTTETESARPHCPVEET
jgi:hypothetical protein